MNQLAGATGHISSKAVISSGEGKNEEFEMSPRRPAMISEQLAALMI
jgi:hypothetical protein